MSGFVDSIRTLLPLSQKNKEAATHFEKLLTEAEVKKVKRFLKQGKVTVHEARLGLSIFQDSQFPALAIAAHDEEIISFVDAVNKKIEEHAKREAFRRFAANAFSLIPKQLAPNILGFETIKQAATLQLFAHDRVHILLIGDPGTGKTEILRAAQELALISSFGLGSGISGVGLTVTVKGKEVQKGILPMADKGLACIDELNLIKKEDLAGLYNAMEKGFVSYHKLGHHFRFNARVSVFATANPRYDKFLGKTAIQLKKELPFDSALLTRFHLVFFVRRPDVKEFVAIAKKIVGHKELRKDADVRFIKDYVKFSKSIEVVLPKHLEKSIVDFAEQIKKDENKFLIDVSPRLVVGIIRLAKASARSELREKVEEKDVTRVLGIMEKSLQFEDKSKTI